MNKEYQIQEINSDEIKHADIDNFEFNENKKVFIVNLCHVGLKNGVFLYDCTITITDWWDFEVIEKGKNVFKKYPNNDIPADIEQIFEYEYDENTLTLKACGYLDIDSVIYYKFIKPKIQITGEYEPD
jgi:hypothetical protein